MQSILTPIIEYLNNEGIAAHPSRGLPIGSITVGYAGKIDTFYLNPDKATIEAAIGLDGGPRFELADPDIINKIKAWLKNNGN